MIGTLFSGNLATKGPQKVEYIIWKNNEEYFICQEPFNNKWSVLINYDHQGHNKCLNQFTGHERFNSYKRQSIYFPKHLKFNKGSFPKCRVKYGTKDIMLWKFYEGRKQTSKLFPKNSKTNQWQEDMTTDKLITKNLRK